MVGLNDEFGRKLLWRELKWGVVEFAKPCSI